MRGILRSAVIAFAMMSLIPSVAMADHHGPDTRGPWATEDVFIICGPGYHVEQHPHQTWTRCAPD